MTTSLVLSCMNVYMAISLIYSEAIFKEMLMYMTIIFEMQMIYTYVGPLALTNDKIYGLSNVNGPASRPL